jgi:hypothetical protein
MREQIVKCCSDLKETGGTSFFDYLICDLADQSFPVWRWDVCCLCDVLAVPLLVTTPSETALRSYFCA